MRRRGASGECCGLVNQEITMKGLLRMGVVKEMVGLSKPTIYRLMRRGKFPRPVRLSDRAVGWREGDVEDWIESREQTASVTFGTHS